MTVAPAARGAIAADVELPATFLPRRRTVIVAEVDGVIRALPAARAALPLRPEQQELLCGLGLDPLKDPRNLDLGDRVAQGAVLVELERGPFELDLDVARAELGQAQAGLAELLAWRRPEEVRQLEAACAEAEAEFERARLALARAHALCTADAASEKEREQAEAEVRTWEARSAAAAASLEMARAGPTTEEQQVAEAAVRTARARVARAEERLAKTVVLAPYDAFVTDRFVDVGDRVTAMPRVEIMEIMDCAPLLAEVDVPERFLGAIAVGDRVRVAAQGLPEGAAGVVAMRNAKVDAATRTCRVRVALGNAAGLLRPGQFARVTLRAATAEQTVGVPPAALCFRDGSPAVFVVRDDRATLRRVQPGIAGESAVEILSGIEPGEQVVVHDPALLADGMLVTLDARPGSPE
ncbi:MAG: efflux RND transporter periplasmic adaptor subunit [Planctomycetes bacterium]|nr:efflux RND transporter periplasmic adaptor subunit [Planctomycetota bacterium]